VTTTTTEGASEKCEARATPGTARATKTGGCRAGIAGAVKDLFRDAAKVLLRRTDAPQPQERRRGGETDKGFVKVVPDPKLQHEPGSAAARGRFAALGEAHREQGKRAAIKTAKAFGNAARDATEPDDWRPDDYYDMGMAFDPANPLYWHDDTDTYDDTYDDGSDDGFGFPVPDFPSPHL
jgi:hypothetical protein